MLLSSLADNQRRVKIPGFCASHNVRLRIGLIILYCVDDQVQQQPDAEKELFLRIAQITGRPVSSMSSRWREPSLTIHTVQMSGPQSTFIIAIYIYMGISI